MHWSWPRFFLTLLVGLLCALAYHLFFRRKGKRYEEVYDRVVEDTNDESTQLRMLADRHESTLKAHDEERHLLTGQHSTELATLVAAHDSGIAAERAENVRLLGVVGKLENSTEEARALHVQITNQKDEYARLELDWRRRLDEAEATVAAAVTAKQIADADAARAATVAAAEAKVQNAAKNAADTETRATAANAKGTAAGTSAADAASNFAAASAVGIETEVPEPEPDDLTVIEGIGPKLSEVLVAAGLTTYRDMASATEERLQEILRAAGQTSPSTSTWGKQARLLADGDRAGFDAYAEHLVAGRDPSA